MSKRYDEYSVGFQKIKCKTGGKSNKNYAVLVTALFADSNRCDVVENNVFKGHEKEINFEIIKANILKKLKSLAEQHSNNDSKNKTPELEVFYNNKGKKSSYYFCMSPESQKHFAKYVGNGLERLSWEVAKKLVYEDFHGAHLDCSYSGKDNNVKFSLENKPKSILIYSNELVSDAVKLSKSYRAPNGYGDGRE